MSNLPYSLPDNQLIKYCLNIQATMGMSSPEEHYAMQFVPDSTYAVIGASNKAEDSLYIDLCLTEGVSMLQRPSGGEAVLISPAMLVFSHAVLSVTPPKSSEFFHQNLAFVQITLEDLGVRDLRFDGISDLCIEDRKILGCSIYRRQNLVLFQSVLNVSEAPRRIARYLKQPQRMPEYRKGREHESFVTSLHEAGYSINAADIDVVAKIIQQGIPIRDLNPDQ